MELIEIKEILKKASVEVDIQGHGKHVALFETDFERVAVQLVKKMNYILCCTELPNKETINTVARNKALKYAYVNEDDYKDYIKAIEEGADYVKNYLIKHE